MVHDNSISSRNLLDKLQLTGYLNTPGVTEVFINRPGEVFLEDTDGCRRIERPDLTLPVLERLANTLCTFNKKHISYESPIHSVTLPDGERGHIMMSPSCENGTVVFAFRKPSTSRFSLDDYLSTGRLDGFADVAAGSATDGKLSDADLGIDERHYRDVNDRMKLPYDVRLSDWQYEMLEHKANRNLNGFFRLAIEKRLNICMVGGTGSGKTTFTKTLADLIPSTERILTIEDTHELDLPNHPNRAHLFYNGHITAKMIVAACMRLKPDRELLTELRGDEAWDYLTLLNTGHPGGLTSAHANDSLAALVRIARLAAASPDCKNMKYEYIFDTVRSTIDVICFFDQTRLTELYYDPVAKFQSVSRYQV